MDFLSLAVLIFAPILIAGIVASPIFPSSDILIRRFVKGFSVIHLLYSLSFLMFYNPNTDKIAFFKEIPIYGGQWLESLGISISFGVDGIGLLLVVMTSFLFLLAFMASKNVIKHNVRLYYSLMLVLMSTVLGVFCSQDMFLFFLFWELELIPMYFLISKWGTGNAQKSAMKFVLYTFFGSIFILFGIFCLYFSNVDTATQMSASFLQIKMGKDLYPIWFQYVIFFCFLIGFGVKLPIFPLHTWLPSAHTDAPTPVSMILAGILLKMGAYGLIRFNIEILPAIFEVVAPLLLLLGAINILYSGIIAFSQKDIKKIIAYSSIQHMGIVLIGLGALNEIGFNGAIFQIFAHGIIAAGLFFIVGIIAQKTKTRNIYELSGLGNKLPKLMILSYIPFLGAVGIPFLMGFVGEFLAILGVFVSDFNLSLNLSITVCALLGLVLSVGYMLYLFHKAFYGKDISSDVLVDINAEEITILIMISLVLIFFGVCPMKLLDFVNTSLFLISSIWQV